MKLTPSKSHLKSAGEGCIDMIPGVRRTSPSCRPLALVLISTFVGGSFGGVLGPTSSDSDPSLRMSGKFRTHFSSLWRGSEELRFKTKYASGTVLEGFICSDFIQVGGYGSLAPFGCITHVEGIIDGQGIAGFGPAGVGDRKGFKLPPVFKALANVSGQHGTLGVAVPKPTFSFLCDEDGGELQLGGFDADAVHGPLEPVRSLAFSSYVVPVTGLWVGNDHVLQFSNSSRRGFVGGILDSGATCICLPDERLGGTLSRSPWQVLSGIGHGAEPTLEPLTVEIDNRIQVSIPSSIWLDSIRSVKGCPAKKCPHNQIVLGDWFFRAALVKIDWVPGENPGISIGKRNYSYPLKKSAHLSGSFSSHPVQKHYPPQPPVSSLASQTKGLERVALKDQDRVALLVPVDIGWPPQRFDLVFDTGSSFFGVMTVPTHRVLLGKSETSHEAALDRMHHLHRLELNKAPPPTKTPDFDSTGHMIALSIAMVTSVAVSLWVRRRRRRIT